jgi:phosphoglucomutase
VTNTKIQDQYLLWLERATIDPDLKKELLNISNDSSKKEDAFFCDLAFGTGGLRGIIGAGSNRMNVYTVAKASQGLSNYVIQHFDETNRRIAVSYDSRVKSDYFAKVASSVFAENGIDVYLYPELMPTPCLSFAVRELKCSAGIMITASHNPANYNGFKVYGSDGCQITTFAAEKIQFEIEKSDIFREIKTTSFEEMVTNGKIIFISEDLSTAFIENVKKQSLINVGEIMNKNVSIVYSPLNGTGLKPILRVLKESGYSNIIVVNEQEQPNGLFPTCPNPNPENIETMHLGIEYARTNLSELVLATDPDCDRVGVAVRNSEGDYIMLTGNETGILLLNYICSRLKVNHKMPKDPVIIKTIVTTDLADQIAANYGVRTINVLTGFKYIGEQIGILESHNKIESFIFGFEESCGYLSGSYVRDKDAVVGVFLICEMFSYYKAKGISLLDKLEEIYNIYGYYINTLYSYEFVGSSGLAEMTKIMKKFRHQVTSFGGVTVKKYLDYIKGLEELPKSNVIKFFLVDGCSIVIRPSGTEPKLKIYTSVHANSKEEAERMKAKIEATLDLILPRN